MFSQVRRLFLLGLVFTLTSTSPVRAEQNCGALVNTLDGFSTSAPYSIYGTGSLVVPAWRNIGPMLVLTQPTRITEVGAIANSGLPLKVQIRPASAGEPPDPFTLLGTYPMTFDNDTTLFTFETANPDLVLAPGTYFALFVAQPGPESFPGDYGYLLQSYGGLLADSTMFGYVNPFDNSAALEGDIAAVRVMGCEMTGPPTSRADCQNDGWRRFDYPRTFKNMGDCMRFVNTGV